MKCSVVRSTKRVALGLLLVGTLVSAAEAKDRKFYLTKDTFDGNEPLTACAKGYHMASLWEILAVSTLKYDTKLGFATDDSGSGPPRGVGGWIRTGALSSDDANCEVWASTGITDTGAVVHLATTWSDSSTVISPWVLQLGLCNLPEHVWCASGK